MDERLRFVAQLLDGRSDERGSVARSAFRARPATRIFERYKEHGLEALTDRSRRPVRLRQPAAVADREPDRRGQARQPIGVARKIRELLSRRLGRRNPRSGQEHDPRRAPPSRLVKVAGRPATTATGTPLVDRRPAPNDLWCADFKGEFKLGNWPVLFSADCHRPRLALSPALRSP